MKFFTSPVHSLGGVLFLFGSIFFLFTVIMATGNHVEWSKVFVFAVLSLGALGGALRIFLKHADD